MAEQEGMLLIIVSNTEILLQTQELAEIIPILCVSYNKSHLQCHILDASSDSVCRFDT